MRQELIIILDLNKNMFHFTSGDLAGLSHGAYYDAGDALFSRVEALLVEAGVCINVTSLTSIRKCADSEDIKVVFNASPYFSINRFFSFHTPEDVKAYIKVLEECDLLYHLDVTPMSVVWNTQGELPAMVKAMLCANHALLWDYCEAAGVDPHEFCTELQED